MGMKGEMNKKKIKIYMLSNTIKCAEDLWQDLRLSEQEELPFEFIWDNNDPDYLIATELIYTDSLLWNKFVGLYKKASVCIYYAGECIAPDLNIFDYAITFDNKLKCDDRIIKMPTRLFYKNYIYEKNNNWVGKNITKDLLKDRKFCNFIYSNGLGHENRTKIFNVLNEYKKVDSLGRYLNNVGETLKVNPKLGYIPMIQECIEVKSKYKFSIAFENATYIGYTSEKVFSSLEAHTVPIYWGNPMIAEELNPEAFINCHNFETFEEVLEEVKRIDADDELWMKMVCSPWKTVEQEEQEQEDIEAYYKFIENIFMQPIALALRKGVGFHPGRYRDWFFQTQSDNNKFKCYHDTEIKWIENARNGKKIEDFLVRNNYRKVVIYGLSQLGLELYYELQNSNNVELLYGIDQGSPTVPSDLKLYKLDEVATSEREIPDVIIVAVPHLFEIIAGELKSRFSCEIISIDKAMDEI